ncbi:MAG TPA: hypothetical protein VIF62_11260 [Labilithrix sp.]
MFVAGRSMVGRNEQHGSIDHEYDVELERRVFRRERSQRCMRRLHSRQRLRERPDVRAVRRWIFLRDVVPEWRRVQRRHGMHGGQWGGWHRRERVHPAERRLRRVGRALVGTRSRRRADGRHMRLARWPERFSRVHLRVEIKIVRG